MKYPRPIIGSASSSILKPTIFAISAPIQNQIIVDKIIQIMADGKKIFGKTINFYAIAKKGSKTSPRNNELFFLTYGDGVSNLNTLS